MKMLLVDKMKLDDSYDPYILVYKQTVLQGLVRRFEIQQDLNAI